MILNYDSRLIIVDGKCRACHKLLLDDELFVATGPDGPDSVCLPCVSCNDPEMSAPELVVARNFVAS